MTRRAGTQRRPVEQEIERGPRRALSEFDFARAGQAFLATRRRRLAGAFFAAALRRFAGFRAAVLRAVFLTTRRFAGLRAVAFFVVFRAVRLFAGGTVTTFL